MVVYEPERHQLARFMLHGECSTLHCVGLNDVSDLVKNCSSFPFKMREPRTEIELAVARDFGKQLLKRWYLVKEWIRGIEPESVFKAELLYGFFDACSLSEQEQESQARRMFGFGR